MSVVAQTAREGLHPLTASTGAEVYGVDLGKPLTDADFRRLHDALMDWGIIVLRDQPIDIEQHLAIGRRFGELHVHPAAPGLEGYPEILVVHADENSTRVAGEDWHSDVTCDAEPPAVSILHLEEVPAAGGDTLFSNMAAAYEDLSASMRSYLCSLTATHASAHRFSGRYGRNDIDYPENSHPVVRTHPVTGRRSLFVNSIFTIRINDVPPAESKAILAFLFEHVNNPKFHCRVRWEPHTIVFWDNRAVQHLAVWDYYPQVRHGYRVTTKGDRPYLSLEPPVAT